MNSGSAVASFLLGAVDSANVTYRAVTSWYPRQHAWILHAGDTWRVEQQADASTTACGGTTTRRSSEKYDRLSFFDPTGANPGAGGRPGRLAFAGDAYGAASYGDRYPEKDWYGGFAPRLGAVYSLNDKTVLRGGWGIFYTQAFYPGWGGGMSQDGFSNDPSVNTSPRRDPAGDVPGSGLPGWQFRAAARHPLGLQERPGLCCTVRSTPTSGRTRTSGTSRSIASLAASCR